jgi:hypothetical protein
LRRHVRSNVVGYVALFFAMSGAVAYAGTANSVVSGDIVNGEVKHPDIASNNVRSAEVINDTFSGGGLAAVDLQSSSVGASELQVDAVTEVDTAANAIFDDEVATGGVNSRGIANDNVGAADLGTIVQRSQVSASIPAGGNGSVTASCLAGEQFLSGGNDGFFDVFVVASRQSGNGWAVFAHNNAGVARTVTAHVYCLAPGV